MCPARPIRQRSAASSKGVMVSAYENRVALTHRVTDAAAEVWVIDPHPIVRAGIRSQLGQGGFSVGWEGSGLPNGDAVPGGRVPDMVIVDASLGAEAIGSLKERFPDAHTIVFAEQAELGSLAAAFHAGADGYVLKSISSGALLDSLRLVLHGEKVFPSSLCDLIGKFRGGIADVSSREARVGNVWLSERELAILHGLAQGYTNKRIANGIGITEATVKVNLKSVLRKLGLSNRTQVAIWAIQNQLFDALSPGHLVQGMAALKPEALQ